MGVPKPKRAVLPLTLERRIRAMLRKHSLARVEMAFTLSGITARAIPDTFRPIVATRRGEAFQKAAADGGSVPLDEAVRITNEGLAPLAHGTGLNVAEALDALEAKLASGAP
jgi:hypothetical protein